jgi:hypothetical protein
LGLFEVLLEKKLKRPMAMTTCHQPVAEVNPQSILS